MRFNAQAQSYYALDELPIGLKWDYFLSRTALSLLTNIPFDKLEIHNHLHILNRPELLVSISHTKGMAIAAACEDVMVKSIGIDIENTNRIIKDGYEKFFVNPHDSYTDLLTLWCEKEAVFKAVSPFIHIINKDITTFVLKDIWIKKHHFGIIGSDTKLGTLEYFQEAQYKIVTAKLLKI